MIPYEISERGALNRRIALEHAMKLNFDVVAQGAPAALSDCIIAKAREFLAFLEGESEE